MKTIYKKFIITILLLGVPLYVSATPITSSSDTALSGATHIDFSSAPLGAFTSLTIGNVTFSTSNNQVGDITDQWNGAYNAQGRSLENRQNSNSFNLLRFDFSTQVSAFGFNMGASNADWLLSAYNSSNVLIESFTLPQTWYSNSGDFFGLADQNISYATLQQTSINPNDSYGIDWIIIDNFNYNTSTAAPVPEPATLLLLGSGILGLAGLRKKL